MVSDKMQKKSMLLLLILLMLLITLTQNALALSIGVSPGKLEFLDVLQAGYAEKTITVSTQSDENISVAYEVTGDISNWIKMEPDEKAFIISKSEPKRLKVIIQPPQDTRLGSYSGQIQFISDAQSNITGRAGSFIKSSVILKMEANIIGDQIIKCSAGAFYITDSEIADPIELGYTMENQGNVRLKPVLTVDIWDQAKENLLFSNEILGEEVLPTVQQKISTTIKADYPIGQYWVDLNVKECEVNDYLTFSIVEKGAISDKGILESITAKTWASTNETVPISVIFLNQGPRPVLAKFKGDITLGNTIVDVIETDAVEVQTNGKTEFTHYLTPNIEGRYVVKGYVLYNNKLTFDKSTVINVRDQVMQIDGNSIMPLIAYIVIFLTIIFLIRKIMLARKRRKY